MAIMDTPTKLNGYPVIRVEQHKVCATIMAQAPDKLVVASWWPALGSQWMWGHYFHPRGDTVADHEANRQMANAAFNEAATRNAERR
jgi:hypothetical protein